MERLRSEMNAAKRVTAHLEVIEHKFIQLDLREIGGSALTDDSINVPITGVTQDIPVTYVPARNTVFLSLKIINLKINFLINLILAFFV